MRRPSDEERAEIEKSVPRFKLRSRQVYEAVAQAQRAAGNACTWAEVRLADMASHFPKKNEIKDMTNVRAVHLWSLAYQRQLVEDIDSPYEEVRSAAKREIERLAAANAKPL